MLILIGFESGLVALPTGNRVMGKTIRGFESHSLRQSNIKRSEVSERFLHSL